MKFIDFLLYAKKKMKLVFQAEIHHVDRVLAVQLEDNTTIDKVTKKYRKRAIALSKTVNWYLVILIC